jgi:hypothetical protein
VRFELDERTQEVARVNESDPLARYIILRGAFAQDADAVPA